MAILHLRKLLPKPEGTKNNCYMCYVCPDYCFIQSPPPPSIFPQSPPSGARHMSTIPILILMLCLLAVAFFFLSYFSLRSWRRRNSRAFETVDFHDENRGPVLDHPIWYIRTVGFPQSLIDSISIFKYKMDNSLIEGSDCSICLSEFVEDEDLRLLPKCSHAFHLPCIDTWLRSHKNCPVCRAPIVITDQVRKGELERDESPGSSSTMAVEEGNVLMNSSSGNRNVRVVCDLGDERVKMEGEMEPVRRSLSVDFTLLRL